MMGEKKEVEMVCPACGGEALLIRKARYEGLTKVGETLTCSACGHEFASEAEVPFKRRAGPRVFTEADRSETVEVFEEDEARICRYCAHYVVNPFTQWCGVHRKEVEATDTCGEFERKEEGEDSSPF